MRIAQFYGEQALMIISLFALIMILTPSVKNIEKNLGVFSLTLSFSSDMIM